jgi:hypothetical protein
MSLISRILLVAGAVAAIIPTGATAAHFQSLKCKPMVETGSPGRQWRFTNPKCNFVPDVPNGGHCYPNTQTVPAHTPVAVRAGGQSLRFRLQAALAPGGDAYFGRTINVTSCTASARW